jgi:hypothetical protein
MGCKSGTPCYNLSGNTYPKHCGVDPCNVYKTNTDNVFYNGGNLPCTEISTCDPLTVALQKIDDIVCPENMALQILNVINTNPSLKLLLCEILSGCTTTTTTTTTIAPTTTTTTSTSTTTTTTTIIIL